ncbi:MAG: transcriptional regulator [Candidatus Reconcilbacillus cellulovorans]|uniref:Transcriptional regulator n=1 Tax=Candidatus Reconcilbacillus cellulovorans TaxID=1906605 RepID=A0A2A6DY95_9BACL|nr:MAG: transcriptional regulator [Candidatus Reconcilbacillus cellulovorans]
MHPIKTCADHDVCEVFTAEPETVARVRTRLATVDALRVAEFFKALSDETRLKMAIALCGERELCVCDLASAVGTTVANASHHLRVLRQSGLVKSRKAGKTVYYSLQDDHVRDFLSTAVEHGAEAILP